MCKPCVKTTIITAGSSYLDIDAYACCIALAELMQIKNEQVIAYSCAPCNYSVTKSIIEECRITNSLPESYDNDSVKYIIVDVSDPEYIKESVPIEKIEKVYDHHPGFEEYWRNRIGENANIESIGAAATLIYREWKKSGLQKQMSKSTILLLIAAIIDNTLNLTSSNMTYEDMEAYNELCKMANADKTWCEQYLLEVKKNVEENLKDALFNDLKHVKNNTVLPECFAQLSIWDAENIFNRLSEIREYFAVIQKEWLVNIIDIRNSCSYLICENSIYQEKIEKNFGIVFENGVANMGRSFLRKEIIKKTI